VTITDTLQAKYDRELKLRRLFHRYFVEQAQLLNRMADEVEAMRPGDWTAETEPAPLDDASASSSDSSLAL
jgi:hypothetical protein